eukprot:5464477-Amphidinium_carterae.1
MRVMGGPLASSQLYSLFKFAKYLCDMSSAQAIVPILIATKGVYGRQTGGMCYDWCMMHRRSHEHLLYTPGMAPAALTDASGIALWGMVRSARQERMSWSE